MKNITIVAMALIAFGCGTNDHAEESSELNSSKGKIKLKVGQTCALNYGSDAPGYGKVRITKKNQRFCMHKGKGYRPFSVKHGGRIKTVWK